MQGPVTKLMMLDHMCSETRATEGLQTVVEVT